MIKFILKIIRFFFGAIKVSASPSPVLIIIRKADRKTWSAEVKNERTITTPLWDLAGDVVDIVPDHYRGSEMGEHYIQLRVANFDKTKIEKLLMSHDNKTSEQLVRPKLYRFKHKDLTLLGIDTKAKDIIDIDWNDLKKKLWDKDKNKFSISILN